MGADFKEATAWSEVHVELPNVKDQTLLKCY